MTAAPYESVDLSEAKPERLGRPSETASQDRFCAFGFRPPPRSARVRGRLEMRQAPEERWGDTSTRSVSSRGVRVCVSTEMCLRVLASRAAAAASAFLLRGKQHTAAHLAARMEYDNAPYPMMATAEAPSNAP